MSSVVISDKFHTARKHHRCDNCGGTIYTGNRYRRLYGSAFSFEKRREMKLCTRCTDEKEDGHTVLILNSN
ncbi:hypothetical protein [Paenibacillus macquariensis]|uniref:hypothetical protein n=1 Tax=Paenibacillus macquariensis TaxID=948756 RepID=UPI002DBF078C|nr:hypothetical protein [Paenibacillus macquariensis]MEC0089359.1 hypothetical protein [Paenibacillus macquariensis]